MTRDLRAWLLDPDDPAVRAAALQRLDGCGPDDVDVVAARRAAMKADPIAAILAAQDPAGWWAKPGPGYAPKYTGTVWQVITLDELGADPDDPRVRRGCEYVLRWCPTSSGGFGMASTAAERTPPPSSVAHCLNGNLLHALIGLGHLDHPAVADAIGWAAAAILGDAGVRYYATSTSGPGFACAANEKLPCSWGAVKELRGLARVPAARRDAAVDAAIDAGVELLLSVDPMSAAYPMGWGNTKPNGSWFRLGFPSVGYVADVLQVVEVLVALGRAGDPRLAGAAEWLLDRRDSDGTWHNRYAYNGKTTVPIERQGAPSKWVTLRVLAVLEALGVAA